MRLGKTNLEVNKNGFGALPIQRCTMQEAVEILKKAYDNGIDFYDTAHFYTDSEEKMFLKIYLVKRFILQAKLQLKHQKIFGAIWKLHLKA